MAASAITRATKITYGSLAMGTGTVYQLVDIHQLEGDEESLALVFQVLVQESTRATFLTQCAALEAAFSVRNGDLRIQLAGDDHTNVTHAGNTGFLARPRWSAPGSDADSNNSRLYTCSVLVQLPNTEAGRDGRRSGGFRLVYDEAGIASLIVEAIYTAQSGPTTALAQAQANFPTYAASLQPSGDWDEAAEIEYAPDDENKICAARTSYRELIHAQSASATNDPSLVGSQVNVSVVRDRDANDTGSGAKPLVRVVVTYSTAVKASSTKDLKAKWDSLRGYLVGVAEAQSGVSPLTATKETPSPEPTPNRLSGTLELIGRDGSNLLNSKTAVSKVETSGEEILPLANGDPFGADVHQGPALREIEIRSAIVEVAGGSSSSNAAAFSVFRKLVAEAEAAGYRMTVKTKPIDQLVTHDGLGFTTPIPLRIRQRSQRMRFVTVSNKGATGARTPSTGGTRTRATQNKLSAGLLSD